MVNHRENRIFSELTDKNIIGSLNSECSNRNILWLHVPCVSWGMKWSLCVVVVKLKTVVLKGFHMTLLSVTFWAQLSSPKKKTTHLTFPPLTFFGRGQAEHQEKHLTFDLWPAGSMWPLSSCKSLQQGYVLHFLQPTWLPYKKHTTSTHTHTLHPHVDRNTHSRNNVTSKTGYRWLQWWETSNDLRKKKNVIFMCDLCKRSAVLFLLTEAQLYFWYLSL